MKRTKRKTTDSQRSAVQVTRVARQAEKRAEKKRLEEEKQAEARPAEEAVLSRMQPASGRGAAAGETKEPSWEEQSPQQEAQRVAPRSTPKPGPWGARENRESPRRPTRRRRKRQVRLARVAALEKDRKRKAQPFIGVFPVVWIVDGS